MAAAVGVVVGDDVVVAEVVPAPSVALVVAPSTIGVAAV